MDVTDDFYIQFSRHQWDLHLCDTHTHMIFNDQKIEKKGEDRDIDERKKDYFNDLPKST